MPVIEVDDLTFRYPRTTAPAAAPVVLLMRVATRGLR